jgi:alginate O-acetyltransferase complex protein AlgI
VLFNSLTFMVFFVVVWFAYRLIPGWGMRKNLLLVASYIFYGAWNPPFAALLLFQTTVDWYVALRMAAADDPVRRRIWLIISLIVNFGMLGFFKYGDFVLANYAALMTFIGHPQHVEPMGLLLPVGISFYTFHTLSYTVDVYRRELKAEPSLRDFALFVSFFPQLVAGPIIRARDFLYQLAAPPAPERGRMGWGLFLMTLGLFEKTVIADTLLAPAAETVFGHPFPLHAVDAWAGVLAFAFQILFDFGGYSLCAIGVDLCFGFHIKDNFRFPYAAIGFSDFWRRWHISLSSWLRDYLYIPLGGNRQGRWRTSLNIMLVMLLGGLWHGAAWTFVIWGGLHGLFLLAERLVKHLVGTAAWASTRWALVLGWFVTFIGVCITWVFFRAGTFGTAMKTLVSMLGVFGSEGDQVLTTRDLIQVGSVVAIVLIIQARLRATTLEAFIARMPAWSVAIIWVLMAAAVLLVQGEGSAFIYFQF